MRLIFAFTCAAACAPKSPGADSAAAAADGGGGHDSAPADGGDGDSDSGATDGGDGGHDTETVETTGDSHPAADNYPSLEDLACSDGVTDCAAEGPFIEGTCCAEGSTLTERGVGPAAEAVDVEVQDGVAVLCGGFGAYVDDVSDPSNPTSLGWVTSRCQRSAFGPTLDGGARVIYLAHHGDTWVRTPHLTTAYLLPDQSLSVADTIEDDEVLFEGLAWRDRWLYVAAHAGGVRAYRTGVDGAPALEGVVGGVENAGKIALGPAPAYVTDGDGVAVLSLADPGAPAWVGRVAASEIARDVDVARDPALGDRMYVAVGDRGFDVYDLSDPAAPAHLENAVTDGSVQAISAQGDLLALAAWNHVQIRRASDLLLLGTRKTRAYQSFEQDFGVTLLDGRLYVAEWEGLHVLDYNPGVVGPDVWIREVDAESTAAMVEEMLAE